MILNVDLDNEMTVKLIKKDKNGNIIQETRYLRGNSHD